MRKLASRWRTGADRRCGFNVAASIKMRKLTVSRGAERIHALLQCGRIYKDAEIRKDIDAFTETYAASMWPHL